MELAAKAGDGDFYQVSVVETRLRKLRAEQAELQKSAFGRTGLAERLTAAGSDR